MAAGKLLAGGFDIAGRQNEDGGWAYRGGSSWTEPTALALLALAAGGDRTGGFDRGIAWLRKTQRRDGGWAPHPGVAESTWVTALVALLPPAAGSAQQHDAVAWLLNRTGQESTTFARMRRRLLGKPWEVGEGTTGWPWYPGTSGWVAPTALGILALVRCRALDDSGKAAGRIEMGRKFLLARICSDGGWNFGPSRVLGYDATSYPETTGMALAALHGVSAPGVAKGVEAALRHWARCRSAQGIAWLTLGLLAQRVEPPAGKAPKCHNLIDAAMTVIAAEARRGNNLLIAEL